MIRLSLIFVCLAASVSAQTSAPDASIKPQQNPNRAAEVTTPSDDLGGGMRNDLGVTDAEFEACLKTLDSMGVTYAASTPITPADDLDCGILRPLSISEIAPGIAIVPAAILRCETALALSVWTTEFVIPASKRLTNRGALNVIENGSGYICRRRNNQPDGKLSEHAFGNAFDVMAFGFDGGTRLTIEPREAEGSMEEAFQDAVRATACLDFATVLGPGSNVAHDDHLHLDIIERSSGYRLCEQGGGDPQ